MAKDEKPRSSGEHMARGAGWMIALRWAMRLTGLVSTLVLARLLTPKDFGIVAMAMIVIGLFEMLSQTGQGLALIRHREPTKDHYDTAWTVSLVIGTALALAIFLSAPLAALYFHDARVIPVMRWLALRPFLSSLENIGTVDFRRDLDFRQFFGYQFASKIFAFVLTLGFAVALRDYWALVIGILSGQAARTVMSYVLHPHRPRLNISKWAEIWSFSIWVFIRSVGGYFMLEIDVIAVGGVVASSLLGRYTVAKDLAQSPTDEIAVPMLAVLFPVMAGLQHDPVQMNALYLRTLGWAAVIGSSTGFGVAMVAPDMVPLVLGPQWLAATPLVGWLALNAGVHALTGACYVLMDIAGLPHRSARMQWVRVALLSALVLPLAWLTHSLERVAEARFAATLIFVPGLLFEVSRQAGIPMRDHVGALWRPFTAGIVMAGSLYALNAVLPLTGPARLVTDIVTGAALYNLVLLGLWVVSGRPAGAERDVAGLLAKVGARLPLAALRLAPR